MRIRSILTKDAMARYISEKRLEQAQATEQATLRAAHDEFAGKLSEHIKAMNRADQTDADAVAVPSDAAPSGWRYLMTGVQSASKTSLDSAVQAQYLATCNRLTTHLSQLKDAGLDQLVVKRPERTPVKAMEKLGILSAVQPPASTGAVDVKLHFRGAITPTSNVDSFGSHTWAVFESVATASTASGPVDLSLVVTKDAALAPAWDTSRFCPAVLIKQLKSEGENGKKVKGEGENGKKVKGLKDKGKGKDKSKESKDLSSCALQLQETVHTVDGLDLKTYALTGTVPPCAEDLEPPPVADRIVSLTSPSLKRSSDSSQGAAAKKLKATVLLGTFH